MTAIRPSRRLTAWTLALCGLAFTACDPNADAPAMDRALGQPGVDGGPLEPPPVDPGADAEVQPEDEPTLALNSIIPNRVAITGGTQILLVGQLFEEGMQVVLGEHACTDLALESDSHLRCTVPPSATAGAVDVHVFAPDGEEDVTLSDGLTYYVPTTVTAIDPLRGPAPGGYPVTIRGTGFVAGTMVRFGDSPGTVSEISEDGDSMQVVVPAHAPGQAAVTITSLNGQVEAPTPFTWYEQLLVDGLEPFVGTVIGGEEIRITGSGLAEDSLVHLGGEEATVIASEFGATVLRVRTPPAATPGPVNLEITNINGDYSQRDAFLYYGAGDGAFGAVGVAPNRLPTVSGGEVWIAGHGFDDTVTVTVDDEELACQLHGAGLLSCAVGPQPRGAMDVVLHKDEETVTLADALLFYQDIELFDLSPNRGSIAGGTLVTIVGVGLDEDTELTFEGTALTTIGLDADGALLARTPPSGPSLVSLRAETEDDVDILPAAFEYFDPTADLGGVWGDQIQNTVNVTVADAATLEPIPNARVVVLSYATGQRWDGRADEQGRVTISDPALSLPVSVTGAAEGYAAATYERVTAENATMLLYPPSPPPSDGEMEPQVPAVIRGVVRGLDALAKPENEGMVIVAVVERTIGAPPYPLGQDEPLPDGTAAMMEDGPFELVTEPAQCALVATAGYVHRDTKRAFDEGLMDFQRFRNELQPVAMGFRRFVSVDWGDEVEDIEIVLNIRMDQRANVILDNPSTGDGFQYAARPYVDFGPDGVFDLRTGFTAPINVSPVWHLPRPEAFGDPDITLYWEGTATTAPGLGYQSVSWTYTNVDTLDEAVTIGPFVALPEIQRPASRNDFEFNRQIRWAGMPGVDGPDHPIEPADLHLLQLFGPAGMLWMHVVPGAAQDATAPFVHLEEGDPISNPGPMALAVISAHTAAPFDFEDFSFFSLSPLRAISYAVTQL